MLGDDPQRLSAGLNQPPEMSREDARRSPVQEAGTKARRLTNIPVHYHT